MAKQETRIVQAKSKELDEVRFALYIWNRIILM